jgi:hypothetical protein
MTRRIAVISASYGSYDDLNRLPPQHDDSPVEAILVADKPYVVPGWQTVVHERSGFEPRLAAKFAKACPQNYTDADVVVWLDAHVEVRSSTFAHDLALELGEHEFGAFRHTHTKSLTEEVALAKVTGKYDNEKMDLQIKTYLDRGYPDAWGMWMSGLTVRRMTQPVIEMGNIWLNELVEWTVEDQLSLPYALHQCGIVPLDLAFDGWWTGDRFLLKRHRDGSG